MYEFTYKTKSECGVFEAYSVGNLLKGHPITSDSPVTVCGPNILYSTIHTHPDNNRNFEPPSREDLISLNNNNWHFILDCSINVLWAYLSTIEIPQNYDIHIREWMNKKPTKRHILNFIIWMKQNNIYLICYRLDHTMKILEMLSIDTIVPDNESELLFIGEKVIFENEVVVPEQKFETNTSSWRICQPQVLRFHQNSI